MMGLAIDCFRLHPIVNQMAEISKKILITTKTSEIFIIRRGRRKAIRGVCPDCKKEVELLTLDEAVNYSGKHTGELIRYTDSGVVHSIETGNGHLLVCQNSLKIFLQGEKK